MHSNEPYSLLLHACPSHNAERGLEVNKKAIGVFAAVIVVCVAFYIASPFIAVHQFRNAALAADVDGLDSTIDFPAVRESLKSQVTVALTSKMAADPQMKNNPFAGLGALFVPTIVGKMVDGFVTPEGISTLVKQGRLKSQQADPQGTLKSDVHYSYAYRSLDRFAVTIEAPDTKKEAAPSLVFERRGLFSWKLIRLELPGNALGTRPSGAAIEGP